MKKTTCIWACGLALPLLFCSCNNKNAAGNGGEEDSTAVAVVSDQPTDDETSADESNNEASVFEDLSTRPITVKTEGGKVDIHVFAKAFCQEYSAAEPCAKMLSYFKNPADFEKPEEVFFVKDYHPKSGYIACDWRFESTNGVELCYWNRKNGHQLVGVTMERGMEGEGMTCRYMFYDYDKTTGRMTPDMNVVKVFDKLAASYDALFLYLPEEGKDIIVYAFNYGDDEESEDDDTLDSYSGKWDGMTFSIVPTKE